MIFTLYHRDIGTEFSVIRCDRFCYIVTMCYVFDTMSAKYYRNSSPLERTLTSYNFVPWISRQIRTKIFTVSPVCSLQCLLVMRPPRWLLLPCRQCQLVVPGPHLRLPPVLRRLRLPRRWSHLQVPLHQHEFKAVRMAEEMQIASANVRTLLSAFTAGVAFPLSGRSSVFLGWLLFGSLLGPVSNLSCRL